MDVRCDDIHHDKYLNEYSKVEEIITPIEDDYKDIEDEEEEEYGLDDYNDPIANY